MTDRRLRRAVLGVAAIALVAAGCGDCSEYRSDVVVQTLTVTPTPLSCTPGEQVSYTISWVLSAPVHRMILQDDGQLTIGSNTTELNLEKGGSGGVQHTAVCPPNSTGSYHVTLTATDQTPSADPGGFSPPDAQLTADNQDKASALVVFGPPVPPPPPGAPDITRFTIDRRSATCFPGDPAPKVDIIWYVSRATDVILHYDTHDTELAAGKYQEQASGSLEGSVKCVALAPIVLEAKNAYGSFSVTRFIEFTTTTTPSTKPKQPSANPPKDRQETNVVAPDLTPTINVFRADPAVTYCSGGYMTTTLTWDVTGADKVTIRTVGASASRRGARRATALPPAGTQVRVAKCDLGQVDASFNKSWFQDFELTATNAAGPKTAKTTVYYCRNLTDENFCTFVLTPWVPEGGLR